MKNSTLQPIGDRIAALRQEHGLTQQALADRIAISRVAVSHIEMGLSLPSERTVTLLAGVFKLAPHALAEGTTYPPAKADRLPPTVCCYTELELQLALLENDLAWLARLPADTVEGRRVRERWLACLEGWRREYTAEPEQKAIRGARRRLLEAEQGQR